MDDRARAVITSASINAMKDIATSTIAFHAMHRTRAILKKENTGMKRMVKVEKKENNPDWLCECCGRAGKIKQVNCTGEKITWHCSECFRDFDHQPRLHGAFRRYRTDDVNLTVAVNEHNNAVDKINALQNDAKAMKSENEDLHKKLAEWRKRWLHNLNILPAEPPIDHDGIDKLFGEMVESFDDMDELVINEHLSTPESEETNNE